MAEDQLSEASEENEGDTFSFALEFSGAACPGCGVLAEPGPCKDCGAEAPESDEVADTVRARQQALGPTCERVTDLLAQFDHLPSGNVVVSNDQFATAVSDSGVFDLLAELVMLGSKIEELDVNDTSVIGHELRTLLNQRADEGESVLTACRELALFDPQGPALELRTIAWNSGRYGALVLDAFLEVLTAPSIRKARAGMERMQGLVSGFPYGTRIRELIPAMEAWSVPDVDARASLVLGRDGHYTDGDGFLHPGLVFAAFHDESEPAARLTAQARRFFSYLLGEEDSGDTSLDSALVMPAVALGVLDRPLGGHRVARSVFEELGQVAAEHPEEAQLLVDRTAAMGGIVFAAAERIQRGFALLRVGEEAGVSEDAHVLDAILSAYKDLAEGAFRTYGWLVVGVAALHNGDALPGDADPPTLGALEQRLAACGRGAGERLAACCDSALRNAVAHSQYRWDAERAEMHDLRTDQRWDIEELEYASTAIVDAVVGAEAGYACFLADGAVELREPAWMAEGTIPAAVELIAAITFGLRGHEVIEVSEDGGTIVLAGDGPFDKTRLTAAVIGLRATFKSADSIQVKTVEGNLLLDVAGTSLDEVLEGKDQFKDLVCLAPSFSDWERTNKDRSQGLRAILAVQVRLVVAEAEAGGDDSDFGPHTLLRLADRLGFIFKWVESRKRQEDSELDPALSHLRRARAQTFAAIQGDHQALGRVVEELQWLSEWSDRSGLQWPPLSIHDDTSLTAS